MTLALIILYSLSMGYVTIELPLDNNGKPPNMLVFIAFVAISPFLFLGSIGRMLTMMYKKWDEGYKDDEFNDGAIP